MQSIGSRELKNRLGTYLRRVREGETILVTDRGIPIAELRPLPAASGNLEKRYQALAAKGLVALASGGRLRSIEKISIRGEALSETLSKDREDRI